MRKLIVAAMMTVAGAGAGVAQAATYDAVSSFSTASNPNGVWSYGYGSSAATFQLLPTAGTFGTSPTWSLNTIPLIGAAYSGGTVAVPANDLWLHPGNDDSQAAILRFTAPTAGLYSLAGLFERADNVNGGGNGVGVTIFNNSTVLVGRSVIPTTYLAQINFSTSALLAAGDTLSFMVDRNGEYSYDSTGLRLSISDNATGAVPEPATWALMMLGFGGIGYAMRRRNKVSTRIRFA